MRTVVWFTVMMAGALAGCTDLRPLQAQVDELKSQMSRLQAETLEQTLSATQTAGGARQTAAEALAAAKTAQLGVDVTNEKIDGMFKRAPPKVRKAEGDVTLE